MIGPMKTSVALAIVSLLFGAIAIWGLLTNPTAVGDDEAIVQALSPGVSTSPPSQGTPTTVGTDDGQDSIWSPNKASLLTELSSDEVPIPVGLWIAGLDIDAPIDAYGVDRNGQMDVPDNVTDVGWYKYGPAPGQPGSAVLAAHVDQAGPGHGLFYELHELESGALVIVEYSDGSEMTFEVVARTTYLKTDLPLDSIFSETGPSVLTLITCGGGFSQSARSYDSNVVVFAVPLRSTSIPDLAS